MSSSAASKSRHPWVRFSAFAEELWQSEEPWKESERKIESVILVSFHSSLMPTSRGVMSLLLPAVTESSSSICPIEFDLRAMFNRVRHKTEDAHLEVEAILNLIVTNSIIVWQALTQGRHRLRHQPWPCPEMQWRGWPRHGPQWGRARPEQVWTSWQPRAWTRTERDQCLV